MHSRITCPKSLRRIARAPCSVSFQSCKVVEDLNVQKTATDCIHKYGNEAALIAWGIADGYALEGDIYNHNMWLLVMNTINSMNVRNPREGQRIRRSDLDPPS